jgi:glycosyltransferase involved in cell wall biosynthesis
MIIILESHPVQYRAPIYKELQRLRPGQFEVVYASDCSVRGHRDPGFGVQMKWDEPLLEGYPHKILNNERGVPLSGPWSLHGMGILKLLRESNPEAVYFTGFAYEFEWVALLGCRLLGIPVWIRMETQDEAYARPAWKSLLRSLVYRFLYAGLDKAFYIGELNKEHLLRHGWPGNRLYRAPYCVVDRWAGMSKTEALERGRRWRSANGIGLDDWVVGFFGKLITKKNPALLLNACARLPDECRHRLHVVLVGAGPEELALKEQVERLGLRVLFCGFVNQTELIDYYLGVDTVVLPSRREGETWGLVVNEALLAGCSVVMSDAVGCSREFGGWLRVRVFENGNIIQCSDALLSVSKYRNTLDWCRVEMGKYSVSAAASSIARAIP